jgi:hypothetical protein
MEKFKELLNEWTENDITQQQKYIKKIEKTIEVKKQELYSLNTDLEVAKNRLNALHKSIMKKK